MAVFKWEGKTRTGTIRKGKMEAPDNQSVVAALRKQQIMPIRVRSQAKGLQIKLPIGNTVGEKDIVVFTRQLATMIDAGLPLVQCLEILGAQAEKAKFKEVIISVKEDVEKGSTFAEALERHPLVFNELFTHLIMAGEVGGLLDVILNRLSSYIEKAMKLKKRVKSAMVYPAAIVGVSVLVVVVLLVFVIPVFQRMFADFGAALPAPTQMVVSLSEFLRGNILFVIAGVIVAAYLLKRFYRTEKGRMMIDRIFLRLPVFGDLIRKVAVARFTRTLGTLVSSGVPILDGLNITAKASGNRVIEDAIKKARVSISEGKTIAGPLGESEVFPPMVIQMISVGETTGALDSMLSKIADFYDEEVDNTVGALTSLLEPMMMVFLGLLIGGLMVAMYLPIFKMASVIS